MIELFCLFSKSLVTVPIIVLYKSFDHDVDKSKYDNCWWSLSKDPIKLRLYIFPNFRVSKQTKPAVSDEQQNYNSTIYEIYSNTTLYILEQGHQRCTGIFIVNFGHNLNTAQVLLLQNSELIVYQPYYQTNIQVNLLQANVSSLYPCKNQ